MTVCRNLPKCERILENSDKKKQIDKKDFEKPKGTKLIKIGSKHIVAKIRRDNLYFLSKRNINSPKTKTIHSNRKLI